MAEQRIEIMTIKGSPGGVHLHLDDTPPAPPAFIEFEDGDGDVLRYVPKAAADRLAGALRRLEAACDFGAKHMRDLPHALEEANKALACYGETDV